MPIDHTVSFFPVFTVLVLNITKFQKCGTSNILCFENSWD